MVFAIIISLSILICGFVIGWNLDYWIYKEKT